MVTAKIAVADERRAVVAYLKNGGDWFNGQWFSWDSEMSAYATGFAGMIERGDHHRTKDAGSVEA